MSVFLIAHIIQRMQTSLNSSPLIHHVVQVRARNVELRQKLTDLQNEIKNLENELDSIRTKRDELTQKSQKLRSMQSDQAKILHFEQSQRLFRQYIEEIDNYINEKQFNLPEIAEIPIQGSHIEFVYFQQFEKKHFFIENFD